MPHRARLPLCRRHPVHVALRVEPTLPSLRQSRLSALVRQCLREAREHGGLRLVHFALGHHHLHLIVEAEDAGVLSRGLRGLSVRLARRLNAALDRRGRVFVDRYFARPLKTPRETYLALRYVLLNGRKHDAQRGRLWVLGVLDPCSSAHFFGGWRGALAQPIDLADAPVVAPQTFLLRRGWRVHGLLDPDDVPGLRSRPKLPAGPKP